MPSKDGSVKAGETGEGNEALGTPVQHHSWAHKRKPVRRSRLTMSIIEKPTCGNQVRTL